MLESVHVLDWLRLLFAVIMLLGPGLGLATSLAREFIKSPLHLLVLSIAGSTASWSILLAWLKLVDFHIQPYFVWGFFLLGWIVGIANLKNYWKSLLSNRDHVNLPGIVLWLLTLAAGLLVVWSLRHQVAGLGSDSYHHTLITQLIFNNGGIPDNYQPANDEMISFSYHYGFHAAMAALMWLSGWGSRLLILVSSSFLVMYAVLVNALFLQELTGRPIAGTIAGAFTGIVCVFPVHALNWGRYPQLAALTLMPVFLSLVINYHKAYSGRIDFRKTFFLALLASGIALHHYRVTIMTTMAVITLIIFVKADEKYSFSRNVQFLVPLIVSTGVAFFFVSPWLFQVYEIHQTGYSIQLTSPDASYYSIRRLGNSVLTYPTNLVVMFSVLCGFLWGLINRKWFVYWLAIWSGIMLVFSGPRLISTLMDTISVIISLYIATAAIAGWILDELFVKIARRFRSILIVIFLFAISWSGSLIVENNLIGQSFVTPEDLNAAEWIKANVPADAYFMVNTYKFGFSDNFIIGIDAGFWLPLLADRRSVTLPMVINVERFQNPDDLQPLMDLYQLGSDLTSKEAVEQLIKANVSYIYIGELGGPINPDLLVNSNNFSMIYHMGKVFIFKVNIPPKEFD